MRLHRSAVSMGGKSIGSICFADDSVRTSVSLCESRTHLYLALLVILLVMMLSVGVVRTLSIMLSDAHVAMLMGCAMCDVRCVRQTRDALIMLLRNLLRYYTIM